MTLRRRGYLAEVKVGHIPGNVTHRELPVGSMPAARMHEGTANTLEKSPRRKLNRKGYDTAIKAHRKAANMYSALKEGPGLVKAIRAAKKAGKEALLLTRALG